MGRSTNAHHFWHAKKGYPPKAIQNFAETIGIAKRENLVDLSLLEFHVREELNKTPIG
jgi:glutaminyl-tRNA synthetase